MGLDDVVQTVERIISYSIYITVIIFMIYIIKYLYYDVFTMVFLVPLTGQETMFLSPEVNASIYFILTGLVIILWLPFCGILLNYLNFYLHYYIMTEIILANKLLFIYHPFVLILLELPPYKQLRDFGVFRFVRGVIDALKLNDIIKTPIKAYIESFIFTKENVRYIFNEIYPGMGDKAVQYMENKTQKNNSLNSEKKLVKKENYLNDAQLRSQQHVNDNISRCISNNMIVQTPEMSEDEKKRVNDKNLQVYLECNGDNMGNLIKVGMEK